MFECKRKRHTRDMRSRSRWAVNRKKRGEEIRPTGNESTSTTSLIGTGVEEQLATAGHQEKATFERLLLSVRLLLALF